MVNVLAVMNIDWGSLGLVFAVALLATVAVVCLFSVGVRNLSRRVEAGQHGRSAAAATVGATTCFTLCAGVVLLGIYLIVTG
jgi:hypothetical protein